MHKRWRKLVRHLVAIIVTLLLGTFAAATMVRLAPGFDVDARQLDFRLSHETVEAVRTQRAGNSDIALFYVRYLRTAIHGDLGMSATLNRSVRDLVVERFPVTAKLAAFGLVVGWILAAGLAVSARLLRSSAFDVLATTVAGLVVCVPSAVLALLFIIWRAPASLVIALVVFPKAYRYINDVLVHNYELPHVVTARAKGLGPVRVLFRHVLPVSAAPLLALAGVSVSMALGAAVPVEALCSIPGIGQLAWQAALGRDLPLLVTLTMLVALITLTANAISDLLNDSYARAA